MKIFARGHGPLNPPESLVYDGDDTFGVGANVNTLLYNKEGEVSAAEDSGERHDFRSAPRTYSDRRRALRKQQTKPNYKKNPTKTTC